MRQVAVLLAGGGGARLWPASTQQKPKQFLTVQGGASLLAQTAARIGPTMPQLHVVTSRPYAEAVVREVPRAHVTVEPSARNTFAAIALSLAEILAAGGDAVVGIFPSDQLVTDQAAFTAVLNQALATAAASDVIVTIGIVPTGPQTGFGYLELAAPPTASLAALQPLPVVAFREKPSLEQARAYLFAGNTLWNSGMFFARAGYLWQEMGRLNPDAAPALAALREHLAHHGSATSDDAVIAKLFAQLPHTSLDYAVMEKTRDVVALVGQFGWSDLGTWDAVAEVLPQDAQGNAVRNGAVLRNSHHNLVYCDGQFEVALVGCDHLVVVLVDNRLLVAHKNSAQQVRDIADAFPKGERS